MLGSSLSRPVKRAPKRSIRKRVRLLGMCLVALLAAACNQEGAAPPVGRVNFPAAIGISPNGEHLVVVNSNFNLAFNAASVLTFSIDPLLETIRPACADVPLSERDECGVIPSEDPDPGDLPERISPANGLLVDAVQIGSYADGLSQASIGELTRLYIPVRSDANLTHIDLGDDGRMNCGPGEELGRDCDEAHKNGVDESATARGIELPTDPIGVFAGPLSDVVTSGEAELGNYVLMAHRDGRASLFFDRLVGGEAKPALIHTLEGLPENLVDVRMNPMSRLAWVPSTTQPLVGRVGIAYDGAVGETERSYLFNAGSLALRNLDTGTGSAGDIRVIRFDPREGNERVHMLARSPNAMLTAEVDRTTNRLNVISAAGVGSGPSRLEVHEFPEIGRTLAFVSCYNSRDLWVVDVDSGNLVGVVRGLGGPFELVVDVGRSVAFITDFRSSAVRIIDLAPMLGCLGDDAGMDRDQECSPQLLGVLGNPRAVQELQ